MNNEEISVIFIFDGKSIADFLLRLENAWRSMKGRQVKWNWILICDGCSRDDILRHKLIERLHATVVELHEKKGDWPAFYQAARHVADDWLLLFPENSEVDQQALEKMLSAREGKFWVNLSRGNLSSRLAFLMNFFLDGGSVDLGSACFVSRELFVGMAARYSSGEILFGYRVFSKMCATKASLVTVPATVEGPFAKRGIFRWLGLDAESFFRGMTKIVEKLFISMAITLIGLISYGHEPLIGLIFFGFGAFQLLSFFGKSEW